MQAHNASTRSARGAERTSDEVFTSSYAYARRQHLSLLVFLLRRLGAARRWDGLADVISVLLSSDRAENLSGTWMFRHPGSRARLAEALDAGWLLLQRHPDALSYEQCLRFLKLWAEFQLTPHGMDLAQLRLAGFSQDQGHTSDAWDFLGPGNFWSADALSEANTMRAAIRTDAWAEAMHAAARRHDPPGGLGRPSRASTHAGKVQSWQHDPELWLRGGRMARELHHDAVESCKSALKLRPAACDVAQLLARLQLTAGKTKGALSTARMQQHAVPWDADANGLLILLLTNHAGSKQQRAPLDAEAAACVCRLLATDASDEVAVMLLELEAHVPRCALVAGCCSYLDGRPPSLQPPLLELRVWQHLAATLVQAAAAASDAHKQFKAAFEQRRLQLPRTLRELRRYRAERPTMEQLHASNANAAAMRSRLIDSVLTLHQCAAIIKQRTWWRDAHLFVHLSSAQAAARSVAADPALLLATAAVDAFLQSLWLLELRPSKPSTHAQHLRTNRAAVALAQAGWKVEAKAVLAAAKLCRYAAGVAGTGALGAAVRAPFGGRAADFWRAAGPSSLPWRCAALRVVLS